MTIPHCSVLTAFCSQSAKQLRCLVCAIVCHLRASLAHARRSAVARIHPFALVLVGDTSTVHRYGRGATSVLR
eukprot:6078190-Pleurochrysis_carterae.AAC.1